jgi:hypothetical protein
MDMLIAGGMSYHSARRLAGKISKVIKSTECRSEIAKERNERVRSAREEKWAEERAVLIRKVVTELWSKDKRSVTEGCKRPIEYYLMHSSKHRMWSYKHMRLKVIRRKRGQMRLGAWRSYISDKLSMSESKIERERERERESSGVRRGSRGWQTLREVVANIKVGRESVYIVCSLA